MSFSRSLEVNFGGTFWRKRGGRKREKKGKGRGKEGEERGKVFGAPAD